MQADRWRQPKAGDLRTLRKEKFSLSALATGEVRVQVKSVGLNFADIFALAGLYSATPEGEFTPGLEFAGVVEQSKSNAFQPGNRVMGCIRFGTYSSMVDVPATQLQKLPDDWSFEQGAAFLVQTFTAWYALHHLGAAKKGQLTLIQSVAGGVGLQALKICQALDIPVIGTIGDQRKLAFVQSQGCQDVIVRDKNFAKQLQQKIGKRQLLLVLDAVGGEVQKACFQALAPTGRLVVFGAAEYAPGRHKPQWLKMAWKYLTRPKYDALSMISDNKSVLAFNLIWLWQQQDLFQQLLSEIQVLSLPPPHVGQAFSFDEAPAALEHLRSGQSVGKVVLNLN